MATRAFLCNWGGGDTQKSLDTIDRNADCIFLWNCSHSGIRWVYSGGMKTTWISRKELLGLVGLTGNKNVSTWEMWGLPYIQRKEPHGGKPSHWYDKRVALEWLFTHSTFNVSQAARKALLDMESEEPEKVHAEIPGREPPAATSGNREPGVAGALARLTDAELRFSSAMSNALSRGNIQRAATCAAQVVALAVGMAKLEAHVQGRHTGEPEAVEGV